MILEMKLMKQLQLESFLDRFKTHKQLNSIPQLNNFDCINYISSVSSNYFNN